jgi:DNA-binding response OmpR family regulator
MSLETFVENHPLSGLSKSSTPTILLVEPSELQRDKMAHKLQERGFLVFAAEEEQTALQIASENQPDLMIMNRANGLIGEALGLREGVDQRPGSEMEEPELDVDSDVIVGLKVGQDEYVVVPVWLTQLLLQPQTLNTRVNMSSSGTELFAGDLRLNLVGRRVYKGEDEIRLSPREFELLATLIDQQGEVLSREDLLEQVWGPQFNGGLRTVDVHVHWLREKLECNPSKPERIVTVRGIGYQFRAS